MTILKIVFLSGDGGDNIDIDKRFSKFSTRKIIVSNGIQLNNRVFPILALDLAELVELDQFI